MNESVKVACAQVEPVIFDRDATLDKLASIAAEAAGQGRAARAFSRDVRARVPVVAVGARARGRQTAASSSGRALRARP